MKKISKLVALLMATLMLTVLFAGCNKNETVFIHDPSEYVPNGLEDTIDLALEMVPLTAAPAMFDFPMPSAPGTQTRKNQKAEIDFSNSKDGYVMVRFLQNTTKQLRVLITGPSGAENTYTYTLKPNNVWEVFPLSDGNGSYTIGVFEQIEDKRYATANSVTINVTLNAEFAPFLRPNQYVNFNRESKAVAKAAELVKDTKNLTEQISAIYNFVIGHLSYDRELAANVRSGYLPDLDSVMDRKKGICFDYASLMTAMLRSQNIPTKLVVGYAGQAYHAWISVYSEETGWINSVIFFDGKTWMLMDPTFASTGGQSAAVMQYIGDGKNYSARFLY